MASKWGRSVVGDCYSELLLCCLVGTSLSKPLIDTFAVNFPYNVCFVCHAMQLLCCSSKMSPKQVESHTMDSLPPHWQQQGWIPHSDLPIQWLGIRGYHMVTSMSHLSMPSRLDHDSSHVVVTHHINWPLLCLQWWGLVHVKKDSEISFIHSFHV